MKSMTKEKIEDLFKRGVDCSQIIVGEYADKVGISKADALKMSAAFGGGLGAGETCGAIVGAMIVLGLKYGNTDADQFEQKNILNAKRSEFIEKFKSKHSVCSCRDLLGYDFSKEEDVPKIFEKNLLFDFCPCLVQTALDILEETEG